MSFSLAGQDKGRFVLSDNELLTNENPVISRAVGNTYGIIIQARTEDTLAEREVVIIVVASSTVDCTQSSDVSAAVERKSPIGTAVATFACRLVLESSDFSDLFDFNDEDLTLYTLLPLSQAPVVITLTLASKSNDAITTLTLEIGKYNNIKT